MPQSHTWPHSPLPLAPLLLLTPLQAATVGVPEPVYRPGVRLGEIKEATVAAQAGLRQGDVLLRVGDLEVAPAPGAVQAVVNKIRCALLLCAALFESVLPAGLQTAVRWLRCAVQRSACPAALRSGFRAAT